MTPDRCPTPSQRACAWADRTLEMRECDIHPMTWEAAKEIRRLSMPSESTAITEDKAALNRWYRAAFPYSTPEALEEALRATPSAGLSILPHGILKLLQDIEGNAAIGEPSWDDIGPRIRAAIGKLMSTPPSARTSISVPREQLAKWESWARVRGNEVSPEVDRPSFLSDGLADEMKAALNAVPDRNTTK